MKNCDSKIAMKEAEDNKLEMTFNQNNQIHLSVLFFHSSMLFSDTKKYTQEQTPNWRNEFLFFTSKLASVYPTQIKHAYSKLYMYMYIAYKNVAYPNKYADMIPWKKATLDSGTSLQKQHNAHPAQNIFFHPSFDIPL